MPDDGARRLLARLELAVAMMFPEDWSTVTCRKTQPTQACYSQIPSG
jgi:hypothetical protein